MEKMIYKFLDKYLGDEVGCMKTSSTSDGNSYSIFSKKNIAVHIVFFYINENNNGKITFLIGSSLINKMATLFDIGLHESSSIINDWFKNKHGLEKTMDLMKFVNHGETN